jgi:hypothetical protein
MIHLQFKSRELQTHSNYNYDGTLRTTGDPDFVSQIFTKPDGPGPKLERLGGTPYHYRTRQITYFYNLNSVAPEPPAPPAPKIIDSPFDDLF